MCEHQFKNDTCTKCGEYVPTYVNYSYSLSQHLPYGQNMALQTIRAILSRLSFPEYTTQVFRMYRSMSFKGRPENVLKIKSIIYKILRNRIGLVHIAADRREARKILRIVMLNFKFEDIRSMRNVKNVKGTKNVNYVDEHLDLILCNKLENGKRRLKKTKELELIHKLHQK